MTRARLATMVATLAAEVALWRVGALDSTTLAVFTLLLVGGGLLFGARELGRSAAWAWAAVCVGAMAACLAVELAGDPLGPERSTDLLLAATALSGMVLADTPRWGRARRARSGLAFSLGQLGLALGAPGGSGDQLVAPLVAWAIAVAVVLVVARQSATPGAVAPATVDPASTAAATARTRRDGFILAAVALVAVLVVLPWLSSRGVGRLGADRADRFRGPDGGRGQAGSGALVYDQQLDTASRQKPGDGVVLRVRAGAGDFWRAQSFDLWDGRTWQASGARGPADPEDAPVEEFPQEFRVEAWTDLVVGAYRPVSASLPDGVRPVRGDDGALRARPGLAPGDRYNIDSLRPVVTAELLRAHDPLTIAVPADAADLTPFLELPAYVPARVTDLAATVTAGAPTAYDKIAALEAWMGENVVYTLDIPPLPEGADAVEQFLFVDRRGFCNQIASSLTVMARSLDIPARVVTGYVPGDRDRVTGEWVVRASDAHAWVEVWFPGLGWQGFDPTASVPLSGEDQPAPLDWRLVVLGGALAAAVVVGAVVLVRRRLQTQASPWPQRMAGRLASEGGRRGRPRRPDETLDEYVEALVAGPLPDAHLRQVAGAVTAAAFSGRPVPADVEAGAQATLDAVLADHPAPSRRPFAGSRSGAAADPGGGVGHQG